MTFLVDFFLGLKKNNVNYCVLRNYESLPYDLKGSDLDILVDRAHLGEVKRILGEIAKKHNGFVTGWKWNDSLEFSAHCFGKNKGKRWGLHIDVSTSIRWKALDIFPSNLILSRAEYKDIVKIANKFDSLMITFLEKLLITNKNYKDYGQNVAKVFHLQTWSTLKKTLIYFNKNIKNIEITLRKGNLSNLKKLSRRLKFYLIITHFIKKPLLTFYQKLRRLWIHFNRVKKRPGLFIAVVGIDGSGKTSIINETSKVYKRVTHTGTFIKHYRPGFLPSLARLAGRKGRKESPDNPHALPPSGKFGSFLRFVYYASDFCLGYWFKIYPLLIKNPTIVFSDRYYYDYFIDQDRYRIYLPYWIITLFSYLIPKPDLIFVLRIDPKIAISRKSELPFKVLMQHHESIKSFAQKYKNIKVINTINSIEECADEMLDSIFCKLKERAQYHL